MNNSLKFSVKDIMTYIAIIMIIISSGSMFFTIMNVQNTLYSLLIVSALTALIVGINRKQFFQNLGVLLIILVVIGFNLLVNSQYAVLDNNIIILLMRLVSLCIIQSCITYERFVKCYVKIMVALSIVSLLCFAYTMTIGPSLPLLIEKTKNGIQYYYTFYHTVGYRMVYTRNAGIFWEAPAYAIFLNIALLMLICNMSYFDEKKVVRYFIILSITVFTTLSVYAFLSYALVVVLFVMKLRKTRRSDEREVLKKDANERKKSRKTSRAFIIIGILAIVALCFVENKYGIISHKLVNRGGSFTTRQNDTLYSLMVASQRLWSGYGIFNNYSVGALSALGVVNNSNGYMVLLIAVGLPILSISSVYCMRNILNGFMISKLEAVLVTVLFFLFYSSEHLWLFTLFISFFFRWKNHPMKRHEW